MNRAYSNGCPSQSVTVRAAVVVLVVANQPEDLVTHAHHDGEPT